MNLELFIKSLSEEEINEFRELLKVDPKDLNKLPTFLEIYERAIESYEKDLNLYQKRSGNFEYRLKCSALGALHCLDIKGVPSTIAQTQGEFHYALTRIPSIGKTTINQIENWFEWYYKKFAED